MRSGDWSADALGGPQPAQSSDSTRDESKRPSKAVIATRLALEEFEIQLFHDDADHAFADVRIDGRRHTLELGSVAFRRWLDRVFYESEDRALGRASRDEAIELLTATALYDGPQREVFLRVANLGDEVYVDLGGEDWCAVRVDAEGMEVLDDPPVRFVRSPTTEPLPRPAERGDIEALRPFLPIGPAGDPRSDRAFILIVAWLVSALSGQPPFPIAVLQGEQGTGKSTTAKLLRALVDPSSTALRAQPRTEDAFMAGVRNSHVLAFDNLSHVRDWLSDGLCRLSTGTAFATRELYTTADEFAFRAARPVILNGIPDLCARPDLADRALVFHLQRPARYRTERCFWSEFEQASPLILRALLDAISESIRRRADRELRELPRMADFAQLLHAAEPAFGWPDGTFLNAYESARRDLVEEQLVLEPIAQEIESMLTEPRACADKHAGLERVRSGLIGSATAWLKALNDRTHSRWDRSPAWPKDARAFSNRVRRLAPALRQVGIEIDADAGSTKARAIAVWRSEDSQEARP